MTRDPEASRPAAASDAPLLEMRGITKRYPGVLANDGIDLEVRRGEIHGLLGENGAGKSTLMNILYGLAQPDEGEILLDGRPVTIDGPADAIAPRDQHGPPALHARPGPLGRREHPPRRRADGEPGLPRPRRRAPAHPRARQAVRIRRRSRRAGRLPVGRLAAAGRDPQGALPRGARCSSSTSPPRCSPPRRRREIFVVLRQLTKGHSIIFISHKLYEVLDIADRITVIRRGRVVGTAHPVRDRRGRPRGAHGRPRRAAHRRPRREPSRPTLRSRSSACSVKDARGQEVVHGVSLEVRKGEILGIAGVAGNGQDELVEALIGLRRSSGGTVALNGRDVTGASPRELHRRGVGVRARRPASVRAGAQLPAHRQPRPQRLLPRAVRARHGPRRRRRSRRTRRASSRSTTCARRHRPSSPARCRAATSRRSSSRASSSGELSLLVLDQPTRGLDVGSIEFIHRQVIARRDAGCGRPPRLRRARRGPGAVGPDRRHVSRRDRRRARRARSTNREEVGLLMATGGKTRDAQAPEDAA